MGRLITIPQSSPKEGVLLMIHEAHNEISQNTNFTRTSRIVILFFILGMFGQKYIRIRRAALVASFLAAGLALAQSARISLQH